MVLSWLYSVLLYIRYFIMIGLLGYTLLRLVLIKYTLKDCTRSSWVG